MRLVLGMYHEDGWEHGQGALRTGIVGRSGRRGMSDEKEDVRSATPGVDGETSLTDSFEANESFGTAGTESHAGVEAALIGTVSLNDRLVKAYLDEVLVILIVAREGACGQDLIQDLYRLGCGLSPGTIYPHLHDLADDGVLEMYEQRRTKQFEVADHDEVTALVRDAFEDLEALSSVLLLSDPDSSDGEQPET